MKKTGFRSQAKCRKRKKQRFACKRRTKNGENCISHPLESQKLMKTAFPPGRKIKITQFLRFRHGGKIENSKNCASATAESQNHPISAFPPRRKCGAGVLFVVVGLALDDGAGSVELLGKEEPYHLVGEGEP